MKYRREFEIPYVGLKDGIHTMKYDIGEKFFELLEVPYDEFENIDIHVVLTFDKHPSFFALKFDISGSVDIACDRCGDPFPLNLWDEFNLIVKLKDTNGEEVETEDDGDVVFWPKSETIMDVSEWIYEFILLSVPMQHIHPLDEQGNSTCNQENLALLEKMTKHDEEQEQNSKDIWKGLDALKNKEHNN